MILRELTPDERAELDRRRAEARATLARIEAGWVPGEAALADAPFLDDYEEVSFPGTALTALAGRCYGHPLLGDRWVTTSPILHRGETWALTESRLYILGRQRTDTAEERLLKILSGRRGPGCALAPVAQTSGAPAFSYPSDDLLPEPTDEPEGTEP